MPGDAGFPFAGGRSAAARLGGPAAGGSLVTRAWAALVCTPVATTTTATRAVATPSATRRVLRRPPRFSPAATRRTLSLIGVQDLSVCWSSSSPPGPWPFRGYRRIRWLGKNGGHPPRAWGKQRNPGG